MIFQILLQHVKRTCPRNDCENHAEPADLKAFVDEKHHSRENMQRHSFGSFFGCLIKFSEGRVKLTLFDFLKKIQNDNLKRVPFEKAF